MRLFPCGDWIAFIFLEGFAEKGFPVHPMGGSASSRSVKLEREDTTSVGSTSNSDGAIVERTAVETFTYSEYHGSFNPCAIFEHLTPKATGMI